MEGIVNAGEDVEDEGVTLLEDGAVDAGDGSFFGEYTTLLVVFVEFV